jgi:hypothetical protein
MKGKIVQMQITPHGDIVVLIDDGRLFEGHPSAQHVVPPTVVWHALQLPPGVIHDSKNGE